MHTDEYEISIGREVTICRKRIREVEKRIRNREERYGMTTAVFLENEGQDLPASANPDFLNWAKDHRELQFWETMLEDYEKALQDL